MENQGQLGRESVATRCRRRLLVTAAIVVMSATVLADARAQGQPCFTSDHCAQRCKSTWKNSKWKSAQDCIKNLPCSKYPKRCISDHLPKMHGDPPSNN
jgi:hypothetical protein